MSTQSATLAAGRIERLVLDLDKDIGRVFLRYRVPPQDAEDLLQDCLLALVAKSAEIVSPAPWLITALKNSCVSYWRRRRRWIYEELDSAMRDDNKNGMSSVEAQDWRCDLRVAISKLPERCQSVLRLRYAMGFETREVASHLGYQESSVRSVTMRCLSALTREITNPAKGVEE